MNTKKVKVGPFDYKVERNHVYEAESCYATANHSSLKICLSKGLVEMVEIEALIHEMFHCVDHVYLGGDLPELTVRQVAVGWTAVMRDNISFFKKVLDIMEKSV